MMVEMSAFEIASFLQNDMTNISLEFFLLWGIMSIKMTTKCDVLMDDTLRMDNAATFYF